MKNRCLLLTVCCATTLCSSWAPSAVQAQILFNDNFNGTDAYTNNGSGSVNPTGSTTAFQSLNDVAGQNSNGALFTPGSSYNFQNLVSITGNTNGNTAYALGSETTSFQITVNDVSVTADGGDNRPDIPNSQDGGFRFELGIVSANATPANDPELYNNEAGGIYVNLFYDTQGDLTGDLRLTNDTKDGAYDSSGDLGIFELASFTLPDTASPLTVSFNLTSTDYDVEFNKDVTVSSGSLSGNFSSAGDITTEFNNGVRASLFGQGWSEGDGQGNISQFTVTVVPEPSAICLAGFGLVALSVFGRRRAGK
jgi:PEP-CTERM motif